MGTASEYGHLEKYRFIITPGQIRDRALGEYIYFSFECLVKLYDLPMHLCVNGDVQRGNVANKINLGPLEMENYAEVLSNKIYAKEYYK